MPSRSIFRHQRAIQGRWRNQNPEAPGGQRVNESRRVIKTAEIDQVPEEYRDLARQVPAGVRAAMPRWELLTRVIYARSLNELAQDEPPATSEVTRRTAGRVLAGIPLDDYVAQLGQLDTELKAACREEDFAAAGEVFARLVRLQAENPEIPKAIWDLAGLPATGADLTGRHRMASEALGFPEAREL